MKKIRNIIMALLLFAGAGALFSDDYAAAKNEIQSAYVINVPRPDKSAIYCRHKSVDKHEFVLCSIKTMDNIGFSGLWEVVGKDNPTFYALNGKALQAAGFLKSLPNFKKHPKPADIDISAVLGKF